jgi:hypothetical protein
MNVTMFATSGSTNNWVLNGQRARTTQAPQHHILTAPVPTGKISGTQ